jgi:hypothetical protein
LKEAKAEIITPPYTFFGSIGDKNPICCCIVEEQFQHLENISSSWLPAGSPKPRSSIAANRAMKMARLTLGLGSLF